MKSIRILGTDHLILRGGLFFTDAKIFSQILWCNYFFLSSTEQNIFYSDKEDGVFFVWRNVPVLDGKLGAVNIRRHNMQ